MLRVVTFVLFITYLTRKKADLYLNCTGRLQRNDVIPPHVNKVIATSQCVNPVAAYAEI